MKDAFGNPQRVVVFGGGSEIGQAVVRALQRERPLHAVLAVRDPGRIDTSDLAGTVQVVRFDATDFDAHEALVDELFEDGDVDLAVVAFGVLPDQKHVERDRAAVVDSLQTNFVGGASVLVPLAERMRAQGHGSIVVLSSVAAQRARRSNWVYGSAKAGLDAFADGLGLTLAGSGVRVVLVRPGFVRTKMTTGLPPAPLSVGPDQVAAAVVDALRTGKDVVWVPSALRYVMSLIRHAPRQLMQRL